MISRRKFIKTTSLTALSLATIPHILKASPDKKNIGLQLYTVRDQISKDLPGTLKRIAEIGYTWLEAAGYGAGKFYGLSPKEFRMMVEDLGMTLISSHAGFTKEEKTRVIDAHLELGVPYVVYPWMSMPETPSGDDYLRKADLFSELGEACRKDGLRFGYHNHDFEFKIAGSATGFDILLQNTSPEQVCFEADLYWMIYAGVDPMLYFNQYPGRFDLWHVKDMDDSPEKGFAEVGEGKIDYARYFKEAEPVAGMKYFFVEQDTCTKDCLESVKISYENLLKIY